VEGLNFEGRDAAFTFRAFTIVHGKKWSDNFHSTANLTRKAKVVSLPRRNGGRSIVHAFQPGHGTTPHQHCAPQKKTGRRASSGRPVEKRAERLV
jgi:hypothetical protein